MLSIVWFLAFGTVFQQSQPADSREGSLKLYQQAAATLQSETPLKAIPLLQQLVSASADSKLATLAAVRLAECYLATDKPREALLLLLDWTPRVLELSEQDLARKLDPGIIERATLLTKSAIVQLPEEYTELLEQLVKESRTLSSHNAAESQTTELQPVDAWLLAELAKRYASQQRYAESYQLLVRLGRLADSREQKLREFDVPLAILLNRPTQEMIEIMTRSIDNSAAWSMAESFSARLAIAEAQRKLGNLDEASAMLEQLVGWVDQQIHSDAKTQTSPLVLWKTTVDLRRVELMMMLNQHEQAAQLVNQCLKDYSSYPDLAQFRFLAARCLIAEIEFEAANEQLQKIIDSATNNPSQNAQAIWMLGEVNFLQRDYAAAIQQYKRAMQIGDQPTWHARALIQMAKCYELQAAPLDAMAAYQAVVNNYPHSDIAEKARVRLEQLTGWNESQIATPVAAQSTESQPIQR